MRLSIAGGFNIAGANATPSIYDTVDFQLAEDLSMVREPIRSASGRTG